MVCANTPWEWGKHSKTEACMAAMQRARESAAWGELERWARDGSQGACVPHWKFDLYPECNKSQWRVSNRDGGRHYLILVIERSLRMFCETNMKDARNWLGVMAGGQLRKRAMMGCWMRGCDECGNKYMDSEFLRKWNLEDLVLVKGMSEEWCILERLRFYNQVLSRKTGRTTNLDWKHCFSLSSLTWYVK